MYNKIFTLKKLEVLKLPFSFLTFAKKYHSSDRVNRDNAVYDKTQNYHNNSICDSYACKDKRVHVTHIPNHGVSHARNKGIELSQGKSDVPSG